MHLFSALKIFEKLNISKSVCCKNNFVILGVANYLSYVFTEFKEQVGKFKRTNYPEVTR